MNLNRLNKILLILIALSLAPACRGSDGGGNNGNGGGAMMYDYKCPNGTPKDGKSQTQNDNKCKECNEGYSLENMSCTIPAEPVGMGTKASPYILMNYAHLKTMGNTLNKHYKLGTDIDARDSWSEGAMGCTAYAGDATLPTGTHCTGWVPVGGTTSFTGSLDGNGHIIMNLYAYMKSTGNTYGGLFGATGGSAEIKNVGLTNIYMNASSSSDSFGGGLVGDNNGGAIINSYVTGFVTTTTTSSFGSSSLGGGLVGSNGGDIINSYTTGPVTVSSASNRAYGGGLVGNNTGDIINSYATGSVSVSSSSDTRGGGLVGSNSGAISNSYATGRVTVSTSDSSDSAPSGGGLVGGNAGDLSNSYATGRVSCIADGTCTTPQFGGLVGLNLVATSPGSPSGVIRGTNYFVYNGAGTEDDNGVHTGSCAGTCTQATGMTAALRLTWMRDTLNESTAFTTDTENTPAQFTAWDTAAWANLNMSGFPRLKYAEVAAFCSDTSLTTQADCTAPRGTWRAAGTECEVITPSSSNTAANNGTPTPDCGDLIAGQ